VSAPRGDAAQAAAVVWYALAMQSAMTSKRLEGARGRFGLNALATILVGVVLTAPGCGPSEEDIKKEIEAARPCASADECVDIGGYCPFGCSITVNKKEADRVRDLVEGYESNCVYSCIASKGISCEAGRCTTLVE
jgi:hypothetical protein